MRHSVVTHFMKIFMKRYERRLLQLAAARVRGGKKGALESEKVVKKRLAKMGMGEDEVMTYRLGGGALWYSCWELLEDAEKIEARGTMTREALASRKKGALESEKVVKKRLEKMGMGEDDVMTYRLGGGPLWYSCWELLEDEEKIEARAAMRRAKKEGADLGQAESTERAVKMDLGPGGDTLYRLGHGDTYYVATIFGIS